MARAEGALAALLAGASVLIRPISILISQVLITPVAAHVLYVLFNDDLAAAKPTTISVVLAGTLQ